MKHFSLFILAIIFSSFYSPVMINLTDDQLLTSKTASETVVDNFCNDLDKLVANDTDTSETYNESLKKSLGYFSENATIAKNSLNANKLNDAKAFLEAIYTDCKDKSINKLRYKIIKECDAVRCNDVTLFSYFVEIEIPVFNPQDRTEDIKKLNFNFDVIFYENGGIIDPKIIRVSQIENKNSIKCKDCDPVTPNRTNEHNNTIKFNIKPSIAKIFVDDEYKGLGNGTPIEIKPGNHNIKITAPSYETYKEDIFVNGNVKEFNKDLVFKEGYLTVNSGYNDYGGNIEVDGEYKGTVPQTDIRLSTGTHTVRINKPGYYSMISAIYVVKGENVNLTPNLVPFDEYHVDLTLRVNNYVTIYRLNTLFNQYHQNPLMYGNRYFQGKHPHEITYKDSRRTKKHNEELQLKSNQYNKKHGFRLFGNQKTSTHTTSTYRKHK